MDFLRDSRDVGWIWISGYVSGIRLEIHGAVLLTSSISILVMRTGLAITINIVLSFSFIIHPSHYQQNKKVYGGNALTPMLTLTLVMMLMLLLLEEKEEEEDDSDDDDEEEEDDDDDDDGDDDDDDDDVSLSSSPSWCIAFRHQKITIFMLLLLLRATVRQISSASALTEVLCPGGGDWNPGSCDMGEAVQLFSGQ